MERVETRGYRIEGRVLDRGCVLSSFCQSSVALICSEVSGLSYESAGVSAVNAEEGDGRFAIHRGGIGAECRS